jgi:type IV secretion system protein VirB4
MELSAGHSHSDHGEQSAGEAGGNDFKADDDGQATYLATIPGNYAFNLRRSLISEANHADYSFLFTSHSGEPTNAHLRSEYLAVLETSLRTPYFFNLHHRDVAHTIVLGRTGSDKSFLLSFLITNLQKYAPYTFIFDLGGGFETLTQCFSGAYVRVGMNSPQFRINPFSLPPTKPNLDFLALFLQVLLEAGGEQRLQPEDERDLYGQVENLYELDPEIRTLSVFASTLNRRLSDRLLKWTGSGQFGFLFDNQHDTVTLSRFQCFDFQEMAQYPQLLEPLLLYVLHRANEIIFDSDTSQTFKAFFVDEAWVFLRNPRIKRYIVEALKTWRKHHAAMVLSTQSLDELRKSDILDVLVESCPTKIFLANSDLDRDLYQQQFHLNDTEIERISALIPKRQMLIKNPDLAKVVTLSVDPKSYWLYTNDPFDNRRRHEVLERHGFERGLEILASSSAQDARNNRYDAGTLGRMPLPDVTGCAGTTGGDGALNQN